MVRKTTIKVVSASKAAELAMEFVKKMVPPIKAEAARLISAKRTNSLWEVEVEVGLILAEKVRMKINAQGEVEEYTTVGPFEHQRK